MTHAPSGLQAFVRAKAVLERLFHDPTVPVDVRDAVRVALIDLTPAELRMTDAASHDPPAPGTTPHDALRTWLALVHNHPNETLAALDARYVRREPPAEAEAALAACQERGGALRTRLRHCSAAATRFAARVCELEAECQAIRACTHGRFVELAARGGPRLGSGCRDCGSIYDEWPDAPAAQWRLPTLLDKHTAAPRTEFGPLPGQCIHGTALNVECGRCDVEDTEPETRGHEHRKDGGP